MIFSLVIVALILASIFYQALHGLFSAFLMMILTILSAALAFGLYEDVYHAFIVDHLPDYGEAVSLIGLFGVLLLLLRVFFDQAIGGNMVLPVTIDRVGGAICGAVTSMIAFGMVAIGFQLLPMPADLLGYQRIDENGERRNIMLNPDGFTVKLVSHLSASSLKGRQALGSIYPDYLLGLHADRSVQKESIHRPPSNALQVHYVWKARQPVRERKGGALVTLKPSGAKQWWVYQVEVQGGRDSDGRHRFTRYNWRLVGRDKDGEPVETYARAIRRGGDSQETGKYVAFDEGEFVALGSDEGPYYDIVFELAETVTPWFVEFKRTARYEISKTLVELNQPPGDVVGRPRPTPRPGPDSGTRPQPPPEGRDQPSQASPTQPESQADEKTDSGKTVTRIDSISPGTDTRDPFLAEKTNEIPVFLSRSVYSGQGAEAQGTQLASGTIVTDLPANDKVKIGTIQKFVVPEGKIMLQVSTEPSTGKSLPGRVMSFAKGATAQYRVMDDAGNTYWAIGEVRIARKPGGGRVEIIYRPEMAETTPEMALRGDRSIAEQQLRSEGSQVVFLFLIPPDVNITAFQASKRRYEIHF